MKLVQVQLGTAFNRLAYAEKRCQTGTDVKQRFTQKVISCRIWIPDSGSYCNSMEQQGQFLVYMCNER